MTIFKLPDLGEGLTDAEIVEWLVKVGDTVVVDQPLVAVETAKAIVEIPSPQNGTLTRLHGNAGDVINVGAPLIEFDGGDTASSAATPGQSTSHASPKRADTGTVAGKLEESNQVIKESATILGGGHANVKATPAVRALAKKLNVDLAQIAPSGPNDTVTAGDVQQAAERLQGAAPLEPLRGVRRTMAKAMAVSHAEVVPVTIYEDADIDAWKGRGDITVRVIRAIVRACQAEPALNAWYDAQAVGRRVLKKVDLGIAVDTEDGLFVPVLRDASNRPYDKLRADVEAIKKGVRERSIPPADLLGASFTLSNFGTFAGRYASPIVVPPSVAILATGKIRQAVVPVKNQPGIHWVMPLSLTFDHRAVTGGEATRFMGHLVQDLERIE